jgi:tetratricopeptide (TPR) repeat protein
VKSRTAVVALAVIALAGCATPVDTGERLYRAGDLLGAIERWRAAGDPALAPRIAAVEAELDARAEGYIANAREYESVGRLAESVLDYRLALTLRPDDAQTLAHVQSLAREAALQRAELLDSYREVRAQGDLRAAQEALGRLRRLDPFEPTYENEEHRLRAAIADEWRRRQDRVRERQAEQLESLVEAGRAAFGEEQLETALDLWRRALLIDPHNERVQAYIARAEGQLETLDRLRAQTEKEEE